MAETDAQLNTVEIAKLTIQLQHNTEALKELTDIMRGENGLIVEHALVKKAIDFGHNPPIAQRVGELEKYARVITGLCIIIGGKLVIDALAWIGAVVVHVSGIQIP